MPPTQRKRSFQLFRKLKFCSSANDDEDYLEIEKMMLHTLDCLGALQCVSGRYDQHKAKIFWSAVQTIAEIGEDSLTGHQDKRHPGATHLIRAFPNEAKATDGRGWLPLHWAAVCDSVNVEDIKSIAKADPLAALKGYNQPISANPGHLIAALRHPDMKVVKCLYDFYPRMAHIKDNEGDLPIHYAARYSQSVEIIQYLLHMNPSSTRVKGFMDLVPLQGALHNMHAPSRYEIVKCLLQADALSASEATGDGDTALIIAIEQECDDKLIELLISAYPDALKIPDDMGLLPIHMCCYSHRPDAKNIIDIVLASYLPSVNIENGAGLLPAHIAAEHSTLPAFAEVIGVYPDALTIVSNSAGTPLHHAVSGNNEPVIKYICEKFPECTKLRNNDGHLPFHFACSKENSNVVKILYDAYPNAVKSKTDGGELPLHIYIKEDLSNISESDSIADILRFLLKTYPDAVDIPDDEGNTPFSLAKPDNKFIRRLLLRAKPELSPNELIDLNYAPRRMAMFLAFAAINANGEPSIFCKLRESSIELLMLTVSYL